MNSISEQKSKPHLRDLCKYFIITGATCFGGPVVLTQKMHQELIIQRRWFSEEDFKDGLTLSQLSPGPLATQIAIYLGWLNSRVLGATLVLFFLLLPSSVLVMLLAFAYQKMGNMPEMQKFFFGINSSVMAIIATSAIKLSRRTLGKNYPLWILSLLSLLLTAYLKMTSILYFIFSGLGFALIHQIILFIKNKKHNPSHFCWIIPGVILSQNMDPIQQSSIFINSQSTSINLSNPLLQLFYFFLNSGSMVYGSGLAILPFWQNGLVHELKWLTDSQFLDSVAIAMITPGPVVIASGFLGFLLLGIPGGLLALLGTFLPCYLITVIAAPIITKIKNIHFVRNFVEGITASAIGALFGSTIILGMQTLATPAAGFICLLTLLLITHASKIPIPIVLLLFGAGSMLLPK